MPYEQNQRTANAAGDYFMWTKMMEKIGEWGSKIYYEAFSGSQSVIGES